MLSVVLPSYNEEAMLGKTARVLSRVMSDEKIDYELIFIDDGSKDNTWKKIVEAASDDRNVHGIHFSRNFGKEAAIIAGLKSAKGDCVAVMDCDLQHPPATLIEMYRLWEHGYEGIEAVKRSRGKESMLHSFCAGMFNRIMSKAAGIDMAKASDFKLMDRKIVNAVLEFPEKHTFFRALSSWVGFDTTQVEFDVQEREAGVSKWSTGSLIRYAIMNITVFSDAPIKGILMTGGLELLISVVLALTGLVHLAIGTPWSGIVWLAVLILFIASVLMLSMGIIGHYLIYVYDEVKNRPRYIISERI